MTRVVSGAVLIALAVAVVWFAPRPIFEAVAFALLFVVTQELVGLCRAGGIAVPRWPTVAVTLFAPSISPTKTIEGAAGGRVAGTAVFAIVGAWWLPSVPPVTRVGIGLGVVAIGIAGDLFESMLKRSAGVKDSSSMIPGHGGFLDRIDALLFAAPVYYIVLRYV